MSGKHGHCSHTNNQREDQTVQGTLHSWKKRASSFDSCNATAGMRKALGVPRNKAGRVSWEGEDESGKQVIYKGLTI